MRSYLLSQYHGIILILVLYSKMELSFIYASGPLRTDFQKKYPTKARYRERYSEYLSIEISKSLLMWLLNNSQREKRILLTKLKQSTSALKS
jgi:hypothetical protein